MTYTTCPKCKEQIEADSWFCDQCGTELFVCPQCRELRKGKRCTTCGTPLVSMSSWGQTVNSSAGATGGINAAGNTIPPSAAPAKGPTPASTIPSAGSPAAGSTAARPSQPQSTGINSGLGGGVTGGVSGGVTSGASGGVSAGVSGGNVSPSPKITPAAGSTVRPGAAPSPASQKQPGHIQCANPSIRLGIEPGVIIGRRGSYASVFTPYGMVSGIHAQLDRQPDGQWTVTDLGSTNGTTLNGQPLTPNVPVPFNVGDTLAFANLTFAVLE